MKIYQSVLEFTDMSGILNRRVISVHVVYEESHPAHYLHFFCGLTFGRLAIIRY